MHSTIVEMPSVGKRLAMAASAALLAASTMGAPAAFAATEQTGTGETSLVVKVYDPKERGGTNEVGEFENPAGENGLGSNLAFTVPTRIDFGAKADGTLVGPSETAVYIENESAYGVHVSSLDVDPKNDWNIVKDAKAETAANSIDVQIGPANDQLDAFDYLDKTPVSAPREWNMATKASTGTADRVQLKTAGHMNNVNQNIVNDTTFGQIKWYVTPGTIA